VLFAQAGVVDVAARPGEVGQAAVDHQHRRGLVGGQADGLVQQVLVGHDLAAAHAGIGADDDLGLRIVDAGGQRVAGEAAEHHRVDGADARAGQHREAGLGDHRHVDQHAVALGHALGLQDGGHALHLGMQLAEAVGLFRVGFGGNEDQRVLVRAGGQVAVHRVVAQVGLAAGKPLGERRLAVVAHLLVGLVPVDQLRLLGPEGVALFDRCAVELLVGAVGQAHACLLWRAAVSALRQTSD
jgi:hypothetical protein